MAESYGDCGAILACVFGRALEVDASNFGKDAPCGVVPPPSLLRSLEFLSALLEAPFSRDVAFPDAACFVIAGEPLRASTVPEALDRVPVLAHAKADDRRGILVPGPATIPGDPATRPPPGRGGPRTLTLGLGQAPPPPRRRGAPSLVDVVKTGWPRRVLALRNASRGACARVPRARGDGDKRAPQATSTRPPSPRRPRGPSGTRGRGASSGGASSTQSSTATTTARGRASPPSP